MRNNSIAKGTAIIALANFSTRLIGLLFRIALVSLAGPGPIGLFQMIFPVYFVVLVLATGGIPTVVARLVARYNAEQQYTTAGAVVKKALAVCFASGLAACAALLWGSDLLASTVLADTRTELALRVIAIALPIVSITAVLRGYLQGMHKMVAVGLAQLVEQLTRVPVSLYLTIRTFAYGPVYVTAALAVGIVCGEIASCLALLLAYRRTHQSAPVSRGSISYAYIILPALPITLARLLLSLGQAVNAALIPHCLIAAGYTVTQATVAFAELTGMAFTLFFAPAILTSALVVNLVPSVSSRQVTRRSQLKRLCANAYRLVIILGVFLGTVFAVGGRQICDILFDSSRAGALLTLLGPSAVFAYSLQISGSILQGLGLMKLASLGTVFSSLISIAGVWYLTPHQGITGTVTAFALGFTVSGLALLLVVNSQVKVVPLLLPTLKRTITGTVPAALPWLLFPTTHLLSLITAAVLSLLLYLLSLWVLGEKLESITI